MRKLHKLAALCAVFLISLCFFSMGAYAAPADESTTTSTTSTPTESTAPANNEINAILPPGTGKVVDMFTGEDGRKFYTIQTPAGNTFYLIIDFTKQVENVYFLDAVAEKDLIALAEKAANADGSSSGTNSNNTSKSTPGNQTEPKQENGNNNMFSMILVVAVVVIGGGAAIYFRVIRKKQSADSRDEYEADDYEENIPEYDTEPEDDSPPWEEDDK